MRCYCRYGISYRDWEEMTQERGMVVDHTTLYRWVIRYAPELEQRLRYFSGPTMGYSWQIDETYVEAQRGSGQQH